MDDDKRINSREGFEFEKLNNRPPVIKEKKTVENRPERGRSMPKQTSPNKSKTSLPVSAGEKIVSLEKIRSRGTLPKSTSKALNKFNAAYIIDKDGKIKKTGSKSKTLKVGEQSARKAKRKGVRSIESSTKINTEEGTVSDNSLYIINKAGEKTLDTGKNVVRQVNKKVKNEIKKSKYKKVLKEGGSLVDKSGNVINKAGKAGKLGKKELKGLKKGSDSMLKKIRGTAEKTTRRTVRKTARKARRAAKRNIKKAPGRIRRIVRTAKNTAKATVKAIKVAVKVISSIISNPIALAVILGFVLISSIITMFFGNDDAVADDYGYMLLLDESGETKKTQPKNIPVSEEERAIWRVLSEYFNNENIVAGIMCNLKAESGFLGNNLEGVNNIRWAINDEKYTDEVNNGTVTKEHFCMSMYNGDTRGYYNSYGQWVNADGGYGIAQFTAYEKKKELYEFAEEYFKDSTFDIGNAEMQAKFLCSCMDGSFSHIKEALLETTTIEEACSVWLKMYEIPEDPYHDGYVTLGKKRAEYAEEIIAACRYADFIPRLEWEGTGLTLEEAERLSEWYGSDSPFGNCGGNDWSVAGHHGNCVSYAWGRRCELEGERTKLGPYTAYAWYKHAVEDGIYETGERGAYLKPGAVVCWGVYGDDDAHQHVAIIEYIERDSDGNITKIVTGNSSFTYQKVFYNVTFSSQEELENASYDGPFQGYIFLEKKQQ